MLEDDFTICYWIKPFNYGFIFKDVNNPFIHEKFYLYFQNDSTLLCSVYGSKSNEVIRSSNLRTNLKLKLNQWNFVGVTYSDSVLNIIANNNYQTFTIGQNLFRQFNDCIYFNDLHPASKKNTAPNRITPRFLLDEFRIYKKSFTPVELISNMQDLSLLGNEELLAYYNMEDANYRRIFDNTSNDFWPVLYGGVTRCLDNAPVNVISINKYRINTDENTVLKRTSKGFAWLSKNPFTKNSSFSIQADFKYEQNSKYHYIGSAPYHLNQNGLSFVLKDTLIIRAIGNNHRYVISQYLPYYGLYDWNRYTVTYDSVQNKVIFYLNANEVYTFIPANYNYDVTEFFMGITFASNKYWGDPVPVGRNAYIDNIKIFNRPIIADEIFGDSEKGLITYWTFQKVDKEIAYDEINNLPLFIRGECFLINEDIKYR